MHLQQIIYNGDFLPKTASEQLANRAFRYGDGLFESIRLINGLPQLLSLHYDRLSKGAAQLKMDMADFPSLADLSDMLVQLASQNGITRGGRCRITIFRQGEGLYTPNSNKLAYFIELIALEQNHYAFNKKGLRIGLSETVQIAADQFSNLKTLNALPYVMASIEKEASTFDDLLLLNQDGNLCEASSSNLFVVKSGQIYTPPLSSACIAGVMRSHIIALSQESGYQLIQQDLSPQALIAADEVFFTNAIQGIRWVAAYKEKRYFNNIASSLAQSLKL